MDNNIFEAEGMTLSQFYAKIYAITGIGIVVSAIVSFITLAFFSENIVNIMSKGSLVVLIILLIPMLLVVPSQRAALKNLPSALPWFIVFSAVFGFVLSFTLIFYTQANITLAFVTAAAMFFGLAAYGRMTKRDLSKMGKVMGVAVWGLIVASVLNFFFRSGGLSLLISFAGVGIFSGLIAWDNQKIEQVYHANNGNVSQGWAVSMALNLYLDFINLFLFLLRIFGIAGGNKD